VLVLAACAKQEAPAPPPRPKVRVVTVAKQTLRARVPIAGVLAPLPGRDVKVGALVSGRVDRVLVAEGEVVRVGQPLAHIEAQPLREHVAEVDAQKETVRASLDNARTRLARTERLWKDGIAARQEVDDGRAAVIAAENALKQATAQVGTASVQLDRATLRAPIAGVVAAILVPAGAPVDGNATPVIEIADTRDLDLRAPVPAARVGEVRLDQPAELSVDGVGLVTGKVAAIAPLVDTATNTVIVRVHVANADGRLRGGMFARGALLGASHPGMSVPRSALLPGDAGEANVAAIVAPDGKVALRALELAADLEGAVEVRAGLVAGDRVIVAGGYTLPEGTVVEIVP
jgi:RND family efflux transporter MFP subunit